MDEKYTFIIDWGRVKMKDRLSYAKEMEAGFPESSYASLMILIRLAAAWLYDMEGDTYVNFEDALNMLLELELEEAHAVLTKAGEEIRIQADLSKILGDESE